MSAAGGEYGEKKVQMNQKERHKGTKWLQKKKNQQHFKKLLSRLLNISRQTVENSSTAAG